jgi:hypothetical protein
MKRYARNKTELARLVGMSRVSLQRYFDLPDHPRPRSDSQLPVDAWIAFIAQHRTQPRYGGNGFGSIGSKYKPSPREVALTEKASAEASRAQFRLSVEKGQYLPVTDICYQVETAHSAVRRELSKKLLHELPPRLEGLHAAEMKGPLRKMIDALSDHLWNEFTSLAVGAGGGV